jgi:hypothetical protein
MGWVKEKVKLRSISGLLVLIMVAIIGGCNLQRKSKLDGVRRAELRIESRIATGVNRVEYPQVVSELAYELLLAKDLSLDTWDTEAVKKYGEVLQTYMAAKDVWEANQEYQDCLKSFRYDEKYCHETRGAAMNSAASKANVSADVVARADAVQVVWQVAEQEVQKAEKIRLGQLPETVQHKN